ncbi:hypothetical protein QBC39DRAFT_264931 [Podospora conica]|nr:hypothetical protein QBC39DRAFT_264931 [Schizothecium conicum]
MSDRTGPDWTEDSFYRGTLQPPLAVRLQNAITFLADEDVDRDPRWKTRFAELCDYLPWLANDDEDYQLGKASRRTRAMFDEAVDMAKAHILFEKHHYEPTYVESPPFVVQPTGLGGGPFNPIKSTRLNWTGVVHDWPTPSPAAPPRRNDQPTRLYPRQPIFINPIADADKKIRERFVRHAKRYWEQDDESESNLAHIEGEAFFRYVALGPVETLKYDTVTGQTRLPDGRLVVPGSAIDWAREQGARRAGLQNLLRDFENKEHRSLPDARCRRVVLPTPASKVLAVRQKTAKPQWTPVALKKSELPPLADLETHLYTVFYRKFTRHLRRLREAARLEAEEAYGQNDGWVTLPRNIASGGPFVLRSIDARTQANQDLLAKCIKTVKVLETESMRASRPLLDKMLDVIQSGIDGRFAAGIPGDIKLAADEWEHVGNATRVRYVDDDDIQWLRFLATESVNDGTWQGRFDPDQPKEKYKLFLIFARRVQKLLDDRDPESLFNTHDAVTVEQLLTAINAGYATSAVEKCKFHPYDACAWLNRLRISGHIRFRYNQANYGLIQRPILQYHPEHRIAPPTPPSRPSYPLSIRPWSAVVGPSPPLPRPSPSSPTDPIHNFLLALALRLGHTIHSLRAPPLTPATPLPTTAFLAAVNAYRALSRAQTARARLPSLGALREALARIRARVIDEVARNENMLHPARERLFVSEWDDEEEPRRLLRRDVSWDFAAAVVRGGRPRFFAVDRWPVVVPVPTVDGAVVVVDASQTADPAVEDPTERRWKREKLRRYGDTGPVRVKEGPAVFPVGDTRAQMRAVERRMTDLVYATAGLARERPETGWFGRVWQRLNPFARGGGVGMPMDDDDPRRVRADEPYLPEVDLDTVPRSRPSRARVVEVEDNWDEDDI